MSSFPGVAEGTSAECELGYSAEIRAGYLAAVIAGSRIAIDDPRNPDVRALLERHRELALAQTPPGHSFALDVDGLLDPAITLFSIRVHGSLLGIGAIKRLGPHHAEVKSMHTAETARGHGIGRAMLSYLLEVARAQGFRRVSLETGTTAAFAAARALYESAGFVSCGPFGGYQPSEDNLFMTLELVSAQVTAGDPDAGRRPGTTIITGAAEQNNLCGGMIATGQPAKLLWDSVVKVTSQARAILRGSQEGHRHGHPRARAL
ncbi:MAG TPA: GNAT family N-acetyltransferase [Streptosporangiaceae bacterium]|jgi:putative acetyltransferase